MQHGAAIAYDALALAADAFRSILQRLGGGPVQLRVPGLKTDKGRAEGLRRLREGTVRRAATTDVAELRRQVHFKAECLAVGLLGRRRGGRRRGGQQCAALGSACEEC